MSTEHQALFVIVLLVVAVAYLYWRVEILTRQVRNLSDEIEHLEAARIPDRTRTGKRPSPSRQGIACAARGDA